MGNSGLLEQIKRGLQHMSAHDLQVLAEQLAVLKFPNRFRNRVIVRNGRNADSQTTKNWPDAYVVGTDSKVDGIEATRDKSNWKKHLQSDLTKALDPTEHDLSGYVFVGGYPADGPSTTEAEEWIGKFEKAGVPRDRIAIFVGFALAEELLDARYAQIRQKHFGIPTKPIGFEEMSGLLPSEAGLDDFQATPDDFKNGYVGAPPLLDEVLDELERTGACLVRGYGAAGKTTLAQLVAHSKRVAPSPSWILDLTSPTFDEGLARESMVNWAGEGVLFVIDNIHLNEGAAARIVEHWRSFLKPLRARLLLLGRKTRIDVAGDLAGLQALQLRAGATEMRAVIARLCRRDSIDPPKVPQADLDDWAKIFGGTRNPHQVAVDLIAFTAAVISRLPFIRRGDLRLTAEDAVDGVRTRYLDKLSGNDERSNLLRLASLAHFEIPIYAELLAYPGGLSHSTSKLGIVLVELTGQEQRKSFRLVHHALGDLLLKAASEFDVDAELTTVASLNPSVGARILLNARKGFDEHIKAAIRLSLEADTWMSTVRDTYDLSGIIRYALRHGQTAESLDRKLLAGGWLETLVGRVRMLRGINALNTQLAKSRLSGSLEAVGRLASDASSHLHQTLLTANPSEVAALLRAHPAHQAILKSISTERWNERQANVPPETADMVLSAAQLFEQHGRGDLAKMPCIRLIEANDPALWARCDVSHLSHILRLTGHPQPQTARLLRTLSDSGWFDAAFRDGLLGPLCGGLMSLANYLPLEQRAALLTPALAQRVRDELGPDFWIDDIYERVQRNIAHLGLSMAASRPDSGTRIWLASKVLSRPVCLLGSFTCLGGTVETRDIDWRAPLLERMFDGLRKKDATFLGMYELQFWVGLKVLTEQGHGPDAVPPWEGERFLDALEKSSPPTPAALSTKNSLVDWLHNRQADGWRLRTP